MQRVAGSDSGGTLNPLPRPQAAMQARHHWAGLHGRRHWAGLHGRRPGAGS
jgi:hypothetical protein